MVQAHRERFLEALTSLDRYFQLGGPAAAGDEEAKAWVARIRSIVPGVVRWPRGGSEVVGMSAVLAAPGEPRGRPVVARTNHPGPIGSGEPPAVGGAGKTPMIPSTGTRGPSSLK